MACAGLLFTRQQPLASPTSKGEGSLPWPGQPLYCEDRRESSIRQQSGRALDRTLPRLGAAAEERAVVAAHRRRRRGGRSCAAMATRSARIATTAIKEGVGHCMETFRRHDHQHYICSLALPAQLRPLQWALGALNSELSRARTLQPPEMRAIRMQFWADAVKEVSDCAFDALRSCHATRCPLSMLPSN